VRTSREAHAGFFLIYAAHVIKPTVRSQQPISQTISCNGFQSMSSYPFKGFHRQSRFLSRQLHRTPNFFLYTQLRHHQGRGKKWHGPTHAFIDVYIRIIEHVVDVFNDLASRFQ
jgi:hypothetical protein